MSRSRRACAFTLVELLVAIGILAVLLSILIPSIRRARRASETAACLNNQRQIMGASLAYAADYRSALPFTGWNSTDPVPNWLYSQATPMQGTTAEVRGGQLWPYLQVERAYRCPGDAGPWPAGKVQNLTSYVINGSASAFGKNNNTSLAFDRFKESDILYWEIPMSTGVAGTYNDGTNYPNEGLTARHKTGTTVSHIDGHADVLPADEFIRFCNSGPSPLWCDPTATDGGFSKISGKPNPVPVQE